MNSEFRSLFSLVRQNAPVIVGMLVMFVCSMLYCASSAMFGRLGDATGVLLFGHTVGNISRYWDPFIMGVFAGFVTYFWGKVPPIRYCWSNATNLAIAGAGSSLVLVMILNENYWKVFNGIGFSGGFMGCLAIIIVTPFGMRGAIVSTVFCSLGLFLEQGVVTAVFFVTLVYLGKWINWWVVNIIRHGFTGAKNALRSSADMSVQRS